MRSPSLCILFLILLLQGCAAVSREAIETYLKVEAAVSTDEIKITLKNSFINEYKNRVTIDTPFIVDKAHRYPRPALLDGDFHLAGRAPEVGLPVVAEIKNAAFEKEAIALAQRVEGTGQPVRLAGAWRVWFEHAGNSKEIQGKEEEALEEANPSHVFEIHPVTHIGNIVLFNSFRPVKGYSPGEAAVVFPSYEHIQCKIMANGETTTLVTRKGEFNDVEFIMEIAGDRQHETADGRFVKATVLDLRGNVLVHNLRMVFVKDTPPEQMVRHLKRGSRLHVFGIPRVDFSALSLLVRESSRQEVSNLRLPYEIIIVGVYTD